MRRLIVLFTAFLLAMPASAAAKPRGHAPVNTALPSVSGSAIQGQVLTASTGSWSYSPTSYSYAWQDCNSSGSSCVTISGATLSSYTLQSTDIGFTIRSVVTAKNAYGSASASSNATAVVAASSSGGGGSGGGTGAGLHVSGPQLLDASGKPVVLHGVNRSGSEYGCIQGWGIFDGDNVTNDDAEIALMKNWGVNEINIGINEDCWLGINGVPNAYGGQNYINAIVHDTKTAESYGIYPVVSLFWEAPGTTKATSQIAMPDNSHAPALWQSVANTFKSDPNVILRLKEEPYPAGNTDGSAAWGCWKNGDVQYGATGSLTPVSQNANCSEGYPTVGMQSLINIIRGTGATNVIQVPGVEYANSMTNFLASSYRVTDTMSTPQLTGVVDVYPNGNYCGTTTCYDSEYAPVAAQMPFMFGEFGESVDGSDSTTGGVDSLMSWADSHGAGYSAWSWDTWGGYLQLITDYTTGSPNGGWGNDYKSHLATVPSVY